MPKQKVCVLEVLLLLLCLSFLPGSALAESQTLKIAAFNIQVFGKSKAAKQDVMEVLAKAIAPFDIVAIQEIRDKSGTAIAALEAKVDSLGQDYRTIVGERLGRTSSKEQYAYMYKASSVEILGEAFTYKEPDGVDLIHREPLVAQFKARNGTFGFVLIVIHTDPDDAGQEIRALNDVLAQVKAKFSDEGDFIILGDLNADCNYFDEDQPNPLPNMRWLISNDLDTTVKNTVCTYDRIIISKEAMEDYAGTAGVVRFDTEFNLTQKQAARVSDHYPVYAEFYVSRDSD